WPTHRGPRAVARLRLADALPVVVPVRHSGLSQSRGSPVRDRIPLARAGAAAERVARDPLPAMASGVPGLRVRPSALRWRRDPNRDLGGRGVRLGWMDVVESPQHVLGRRPRALSAGPWAAIAAGLVATALGVGCVPTRSDPLAATAATLDGIDAIVEDEIAAGRIPGAVVVVG